MYGILIGIILYFIIAIGIYIGVSVGKLNMDFQSKSTGEWVDKDTQLYEILKVIFSIGWIVLAIKTILRGIRGESND